MPKQIDSEELIKWIEVNKSKHHEYDSYQVDLVALRDKILSLQSQAISDKKNNSKCTDCPISDVNSVCERCYFENIDSMADSILKKHEDNNEYHFHETDRKFIVQAMKEYASIGNLNPSPPKMSIEECRIKTADKYGYNQ